MKNKPTKKICSVFLLKIFFLSTLLIPAVEVRAQNFSDFQEIRTQVYGLAKIAGSLSKEVHLRSLGEVLGVQTSTVPLSRSLNLFVSEDLKEDTQEKEEYREIVFSSQCPADLNHDGRVDVSDMLYLLSAWGPNPGHPADLNGNGIVDSVDLEILLSSWGECDKTKEVYTLFVNHSGSGDGIVISSPTGIVCGGGESACVSSFTAGTQVTLIAIPDPNSSFSGWSGACSGTGSCVTTINSDTSVGVSFNSQLNTTTSITQYGITWNFSSPVPYGQFANGDYWVLGPVTITSMSPEYLNGRNGWEVDPSDIIYQGFDNRISNFDPGKILELPYVVNPNPIVSIVKSVSNEVMQCPDNPHHSCPLLTAAVLTVVDEIPPNLGSTVFRPNYFSENKVYHSINDINLDILPNLTPPNSTPNENSLQSTSDGNFRRVHMDHKWNWMGRALHPHHNLQDYGAEIARDNTRGFLYFLTEGSHSGITTPFLTYYLQAGIDLYHMMANGLTWPPNGGHSEGRLLPVLFAAAILENDEMKQTISNSPESFSEIMHLQKTHQGNSVWGQIGGTINSYWNRLAIDGVGARDTRDPYGFIDGGLRPGRSYQHLQAKNFKYIGLSLNLMSSAFNDFWDRNHTDLILDYADRWVEHGAWTQPDVCAPLDGICVGGTMHNAQCTSRGETGIDSCGGVGGCNIECPGGGYCDYSVNWPSNYGVTYGHNESTQMCILDPNLEYYNSPTDFACKEGMLCGRFPLRHGTFGNTGQYNTIFGEDMWNLYRFKSSI
jgi:hypothetical protein